MTQETLNAPPTSESGFTLVEALVAILVLAVGLVSVANLMVVAGTSNSVANASTASATIASQELETLTAIPYDQLVEGGDLEADDPSGLFSNTLDVPGVGQVRTRWTVTRLDNQSRFIRVRSELLGGLAGPRSRTDFTIVRSCTSVPLGCPPPP
jgi:prepilin-type N-terminal cleavage/methylation domain-containing protein